MNFLKLWWEKKISTNKVKLLISWKEWTSLFRKVYLVQGTDVIYYFLSFMQGAAKPLLAFVERRPFFNQSHPHFWPSAAEWLPLFFPIAPCPTYCLHCLKQAMPKLAALSRLGVVFFFFSHHLSHRFLCVCFVQTGLRSVSKGFPLWQRRRCVCKQRQWCNGDILNIKHIKKHHLPHAALQKVIT